MLSKVFKSSLLSGYYPTSDCIYPESRMHLQIKLPINKRETCGEKKKRFQLNPSSRAFCTFYKADGKKLKNVVLRAHSAIHYTLKYPGLHGSWTQ